MNCYEINQSDPIQILACFNINPVSITGSEAKFHAPYRRDDKPSLTYNLDKKLWFDFGIGCGGKLVDLLMKLYQTDSVSEMLKKFNEQFKSQDFSFSQPKEKIGQAARQSSKLIMLSVGPIDSFGLVKYLNSRGISKRSWNPYLEEMKFLIGDKKGYGLAFENDSNGYEVRTERLQFCHGKKDITTLMKSPDDLLIFEGFIDFLSLIELKKYDNESIIVLNSTSNTGKGVSQAMGLFPGANVKVFMDNDKAGQQALQSILEAIPNAIDQSKLYGNVNDLNDMLQGNGRQNQQRKGRSM